MDIPPEVQIRGSIQPGSVYYFPEEKFKSTDPHYFVVLNVDPLTDETLILVCSSSQAEKVEEYRRSAQLPKKTIVTMTPSDYECFTKTSVFNCNEIHRRTIQQLVDKLKRGELKLKTEMDAAHVTELREAVLLSPMVSQKYKRMLK